MSIPENDTQLWKGFDGHGLYAKRAERDRDGNPIVSTYARKTEVPALTDSLTTSTTTAVTPSAVKSAIDAIVKIPATANQPSTLCVTGQAPGWTGWENEQVDVPYVTEKIAGRKYRIVQIGNQWWTAENLDYQIPGVRFNPASDPGENSAQMYYNRDSKYSLDGTYKLGMMYTGGAVAFNLVPSIPTLAPGWHVATKADWDTLISTIGGTSKVSKLKSIDGSVTQDFPSGWNGTDEYGFNVLPGGNGERRSGYAPTSGGLGTSTRHRLGGSSSYNTDVVYITQTKCTISTRQSYAYFGYVRLVKNIS